jgi:phosphinothricin acetyltransferase
MTHIRSATPDDLPAITAIYSHYVLHTTATFELAVPALQEMLERFNRITAAGFPFLVITIEGEVAGYAYAAPYRVRPAYRFTAEDSIYLAPEYCGKGYGAPLLAALLEQCRKMGLRQVIAVIGGDNPTPSLSLHTRLGFHEAGRLTGIGYKFDRWLDTILMQREL